jgi:hypothetical protein
MAARANNPVEVSASDEQAGYFVVSRGDLQGPPVQVALPVVTRVGWVRGYAAIECSYSFPYEFYGWRPEKKMTKYDLVRQH